MKAALIIVCALLCGLVLSVFFICGSYRHNDNEHDNDTEDFEV